MESGERAKGESVKDGASFAKQCLNRGFDAKAKRVGYLHQ